MPALTEPKLISGNANLKLAEAVAHCTAWLQEQGLH